ncbi:MAG: hypothetical protein HGA54_10165 [Actinobacteria bacterium]|nr:hypothetical protein [Actinomycetota bacterium]
MGSIELAIAYPSVTGGVLTSFSEFASIFAITQLPLSIIEGLLTMLIFRYIRTYNEAELCELGVIENEDVDELDIVDEAK